MTRDNVLVYASNPDSPAYRALKQVFEITNPIIQIGYDLVEELKTGKYGLVIDAIALDLDTMASQKRLNNRFREDSEKVRSLDSSISIKFATNPSTVLRDIISISAEFTERKEK